MKGEKDEDEHKFEVGVLHYIGPHCAVVGLLAIYGFCISPLCHAPVGWLGFCYCITLYTIWLGVAR